MKIDQEAPEAAVLVQTAIERHQGALLRYATRLLAGDAVRARESVDGAFAELKLQPVEEVQDDVAIWLFAACRKRAFTVLQREGRMKRFEAGEAEQNVPPGPAAGEVGETEEAHVTMQRLLDRLTAKQQEAMRLKFQDGFSHQEIARITDLSVTNAGLLVHNAVARLGREFEELRAGPDGVPSGTRGSDDSRLTLYALGEMEDAERKRFENSLLDKKTAGTRIDKIRATCSLIGKTLAIEAGAPAPRTVRRKRAKRRHGAALWLSFPRILLVLAGVAALVGLGWFFLRDKSAPDTTIASGNAPDFRLKAASWEAPREGAKSSPVQPDLASGSGTDSMGGLRGLRPAPLQPARAVAAGSAGATDVPAPLSEEAPAVIRGDNSGRVPESPPALARGREGEVKAVALPPGPRDAPAETVAPTEKAVSNDEPESDDAADATSAPPPAAGKSQALRQSVRATGGDKPEPAKEEFDSPGEVPVSPLPVDVEPTRMAALKQSLASGRLPPAGSVRIDQMLNYFPFHYAAPEAPADFAPAIETAEAPWAPSHRLVRIGLKGREATPPVRSAANIVLLLDTSGSMAAPNRLPLVKEAARLLLEHLRPDDRVSIVTYAGESRLTLMPTPVAQARKIRDAIGGLQAGGMTNGGAGLALAYDLAKAHAVPGGVNCIILCTDGDFNVGPTSPAELARLVDREAKSGVQLSIFGFGRNGRIDPRLEALAAHGRGASGYVNTRREAEQVLTAQVNGLFEPLARDVRVEVAFNPATVKSYHLIGSDEMRIARPDGVMGGMQTNSVLPGHTMTALYEVVRVDGAPAGAELCQLRVSYRRPKTTEVHRVEFACRDNPAAFADASQDFKFAAAVAAFGMALGGPPENRAGVLAQAEAWGRECLGDDAGGYRSEFLAMVEQTRAAAVVASQP